LGRAGIIGVWLSPRASPGSLPCGLVYRAVSSLWRRRPSGFFFWGLGLVLLLLPLLRLVTLWF